MYTVRIGDKDVPVRDLPTLEKMLQAGQVQKDSPVYDHGAEAWLTVEDVLAPPAIPVDFSDGSPSEMQTQQMGYQPGIQKTIPPLAITSFVLSMIGVSACSILGIVGIILGYQAKGMIDKNPHLYNGRGFALAGIIIGWVQVVIIGLAVLGFLAFFLFFSAWPDFPN